MTGDSLLLELAARGLRLVAEPGEPPGFDREALVRAGAYVEGLRARALAGTAAALQPQLGALLGECLRAAHGGEWAEVEDEWALRLPNGCAVFPFTAAREHLELGAGASVLRYYDHVSAVLHADDAWDISFVRAELL